MLADLESVAAVVEIEEEAGEYGFGPDRIFGKWSGAAFSRSVIRSGESALLATAYPLIQIVNNAGLTAKSCKRAHYRNLERCVRDHLPFGSVSEYFLFDGDEEEFRTGDTGQRLRATVLDIVRRRAEAAVARPYRYVGQ